MVSLAINNPSISVVIPYVLGEITVKTYYGCLNKPAYTVKKTIGIK
jgi:hypothetical protein